MLTSSILIDIIDCVYDNRRDGHPEGARPKAERFGENDLGIVCSAGAEVELRPPGQGPVETIAVVHCQVEHVGRA